MIYVYHVYMFGKYHFFIEWLVHQLINGDNEMRLYVYCCIEL